MAYQLALNWPEFLAHYWQKQPVVIRQAFKNFVDPITPDELAGLAMESEVDSRLVNQNDGTWQVAYGPFTSFDHLPETQWSLLVQAVNHWQPTVADLISPFRVLSDWRMDDLMVSFSVPGGGVGPHLDHYDVFIIQGRGRRRWRVGANHSIEQHAPHPDLLQVSPFAPIIDEVLEPGDLVYIPPGFPHEGYSLENSLNYSVGFRAPSGKELISSFADYVLANDLGTRRYSDPKLSQRKEPAEILPHELQAIRELMSNLLNSPTHFGNWFGEFISQSRHELDISPIDPPYQPEEIQTALEDGAWLQRIGGLRVLRIEEKIWINGENFDCRDPNLLYSLANQHQLTLDDLQCALEKPALLSQITGLVNSGYWYLTDEESQVKN